MGYVKEYLDLDATPEKLAVIEEEFRKPVREWEKKFVLGMPYGDVLVDAKDVVPQMCYYARNGIPMMTFKSQYADIQRNEFALATLKEDFDYMWYWLWFAIIAAVNAGLYGLGQLMWR